MTNGRISRTAISVTTSTTTFSRLLEPFIGAWPVWTTSRDQRSQARSKRKTSALLLTVRFVRGSGGAPLHTPPRPSREIVETAPCDDICRLRRYLRRMLRAQKHLRVGGEWAGTDILRTDSFCERAIRRPKLDAAAINYFIATMACAENDGLNVFGCGRLVAGIGFLRLPASRTSALGILTYPRKPGGA